MISGISLGNCFTPHRNPQSDSVITLAEGGKANAVIVIDKDAPVYEKHAAKELACFLKQITGSDFSIVNKTRPNKISIRVGKQQAKNIALSKELETLGPDGVLLRSTDENIILAGRGTRGTLYAVYTFLEDQLGCRWWTNNSAFIPSISNLVIEPFDVQYTPVIKYREVFWKNAFDPDWAVRNKNNGHHADRLGLQRGNNYSYGPLFVHTFYTRHLKDGKEVFGGLLRPDLYFEKHPEWYSLINGKRTYTLIAEPGGNKTTMPAQLCLTNVQMRQQLTENLKRVLRDNPGLSVVSVSQNDEHPGWDGRCECEKCQASDKRYGGPSGTLMNFVNAVACDIEKEFPEIQISTLAYHYTRKPGAVKPRKNVIVRLCPIEAMSSKPLSHPWNESFYKALKAWSRHAKQLFIWEYPANYAHTFKPQPNVLNYGKNIKTYANNNVVGVFSEGIMWGAGGEMAHLKAWVIAKLLWNSELDTNELVKEFTLGYYGKAGPYLMEYFKLIHDAVDKSGDKLVCFDGVDAKFLNYETMAKSMDIMNKAKKSVGDDSLLLLRVDEAILPIQYVAILKWKEFKQEAKNSNRDWPFGSSIKELYNDFKSTMKKFGFEFLREGHKGFEILDGAVERN